MNTPQPNVAVVFLSSTFKMATKAVTTLDDGISIAHRETRYQNAKNAISNNVAITNLLAENNLTIQDIPSLDDWMNY